MLLSVPRALRAARRQESSLSFEQGRLDLLPSDNASRILLVAGDTTVSSARCASVSGGASALRLSQRASSNSNFSAAERLPISYCKLLMRSHPESTVRKGSHTRARRRTDPGDKIAGATGCFRIRCSAAFHDPEAKLPPCEANLADLPHRLIYSGWDCHAHYFESETYPGCVFTLDGGILADAGPGSFIRYQWKFPIKRDLLLPACRLFDFRRRRSQLWKLRRYRRRPRPLRQYFV